MGLLEVFDSSAFNDFAFLNPILVDLVEGSFEVGIALVITALKLF